MVGKLPAFSFLCVLLEGAAPGGEGPGNEPKLTLNLPEDVLVAIFKFLDLSDLCRVSVVCRHLANVASDNYLWRGYWDNSKYLPFWEPYQVAPALQTHREKLVGKQGDELENIQKYLMRKMRATKQVLSWYSYNTYNMNGIEESAESGWTRTVNRNGRREPEFISLRAMVLGGEKVGKNSLAFALHKYVTRRFLNSFVKAKEADASTKGCLTLMCRMFPNYCTSLDHNKLSKLREQEDEVLGIAKRSVTFGTVPLHLFFEVVPVGRQFGQIVRRELYEDVAPNVILLLYSVDNFHSFNAISKWMLPLIKSTYNAIPVLLIGTKSDMREDGEEETISYEQGIEMSYLISAHNFVECSIASGQGLERVLNESLQLAMRECLTRFSFEESPYHRIHEDLQCDGCKVGPVVGLCYKCTECFDYHLCHSCYQAMFPKIHPHRFQMVTRKRKNRSSLGPEGRRSEQIHTDTFSGDFRHRNSVLAAPEKAEDVGGEEESEGLQEGSGDKRHPGKTSTAGTAPSTKRKAESPGGVFEKSGLGAGWKSKVEDVFQLFSKVPQHAHGGRVDGRGDDSTLGSGESSDSPPTPTGSAKKKRTMPM